MTFIVIDKRTGQEANEYKVALRARKKWAKDLMVDDLEGWALQQDGTLILCDECGNFAYPPQKRFEVKVIS
jgi:hypothetical protein